MRTFAAARRDGSLQLEDPLKIPLAPAASTNSPSMAQTGKLTQRLRNLLSTAIGRCGQRSPPNFFVVYQILYVRGTPASGKSVLLNLLHQQLRVQCPSLRIISITTWPEAMNELQSRSYLERLLGCSLSKLAMVPPTVILVDEAQTTKGDKYFWNTFLKLMVQPSDMPLLVCLFAAYGSAGSNPVEIPSITLPVLSRIQRVKLQWYGTDKDQAVGLYLSRKKLMKYSIK